MDYSKEELLTIGKFFEIPNIDGRKTDKQLKLTIEKWFIMGKERVRLMHFDEITNKIEMKIDDDYDEFMQLARENLHLSLDLKLEKLSHFFMEKVKQQLQDLDIPDIMLNMLNHPNFVKIIVWGMKEIFYNPNFDVERFKLGIFVEYIRLFSNVPVRQHQGIDISFMMSDV